MMKKHLATPVCLLLLVPCLLPYLVPHAARATIVNTLSGFSDQNPGWSGTIRASFSRTGGNTDIGSLEAAGRAQWRTERSRWRFLSGATRKTSQGEEVARSLVAHIRHNWRLDGSVHTLAFLQAQQNPFQRLKARYLAGAGLRIDLVRREAFTLSLGAAHMVEIEEIEDVSGRDTDHRLSSFLNIRWLPREDLLFNVIAFLQPGWSRFADRRAIALASLQVRLGGGFALSWGGDIQYDSEPPAGVETTDWEVKTGLSYEL